MVVIVLFVVIAASLLIFGSQRCRRHYYWDHKGCAHDRCTPETGHVYLMLLHSDEAIAGPNITRWCLCRSAEKRPNARGHSHRQCAPERDGYRGHRYSRSTSWCCQAAEESKEQERSSRYESGRSRLRRRAVTRRASPLLRRSSPQTPRRHAPLTTSQPFGRSRVQDGERRR
jgi:hypothetical protein